MAIRTAHTQWRGTLLEGSGDVELTSSGAANFAVSFPRRAAENAEGVTSPEELIAAAHSSCFAMQFSAMLVEAGATPESLDVTAEVTLSSDPAGGFRISGIALRVRGVAAGLDNDRFAAVAEDAKRLCPVSKALTGTEITLDAALA